MKKCFAWMRSWQEKICKYTCEKRIERKERYMMFYPYEKGENVVKIILAILDGAGFVILCIEAAFLIKEANFSTSNISSSLIIIFGFSVFMFILINLLCIGIMMYVKSDRNKHIKNVMNLGYRTNGKVLSIEHYRKCAGGHIIEAYWLIVQFMDRDGIVKTFKTPAIMLVPKPGYAITCDVFIYKNTCYAYNFTNYYIEDNLNKEMTIVLIIVMVFVLGITMLSVLAILLI